MKQAIRWARRERDLLWAFGAGVAVTSVLWYGVMTVVLHAPHH